MLSVSETDVTDSEYPERPQIVSIESECIDDDECEFQALIKLVIDGPDGKAAVLSRFSPIRYEETEGIEKVFIEESYFSWDGGLEKAGAGREQSTYLPTHSADDKQEFLESCLELFPSDEAPGWYDNVRTVLGWREENNG